jgi:hypothetical protein
VGRKDDRDADVAAALGVLERLGEQASNCQDLGSIGQLFHQLPARLFLKFMEVRKKKRTVNEVAGGVVTFGATPAPVVLYEGPTGRRHVQGPATPVGAAGPNSSDLSPSPDANPGNEDNSLGNVHRGEPRCTFPNERPGVRLLTFAIAQTEEFTADTFFSLAQTVDLGTAR